mmetsp:Transcript_40467/g.114435  ORF Transcript_40467/g.114435 Transcript_40467/m.114435 type:complete len:298 (-) Transcript_40467:211-1104(-)
MARAARVLFVATLLALCCAPARAAPLEQPVASETAAEQPQAVEQARAAYDGAARRSADAVGKLEAYARALPSEAQVEAASIRLRAAEGPARGAAGRLRDALREARATRRREVWDLGRDARATAREAYTAALGLERAQRRSGLSEAEYEAEFRRHEAAAELMMDRAEDLPGEVEAAVEDFADRVEREVEAMASSARDSAEAWAAEAASEIKGAVGSKVEMPEGGKTDQIMEQGAEQPMRRSSGGAQREQPLATAEVSTERRWAPMYSVLLVMLGATAAGAFAMRTGATRSEREATLLG